MKEKDDRKITMELTQYMFDLFKETFDIELELLQGEVTKMDDGRWKCEITVNGYKRKMFEDFMKIIISKPSADINVKFMGTQINPN